jgi:hypothetical protein
MPDPLLTDDALDAMARPHWPMGANAEYLIRARLRERIERDARAFLAAHDPKALAREYVREARSKGTTPSFAGFARWLGLGGDDA